MSILYKNPSIPHQRSVQAGFTLVEIMVGLVIGMLATLVIMQVFSVFEAQKQTTIGSSDATTNGNIAFFKIGRDIQSAGYALTPLGEKSSPLKCAAINIDPLIQDENAVGAFTDLTPVSILDGTSDTITIRYGSTELGGVPTLIDALIGNALTLKSTLGCVKGDYALVMSGNICGITKVDDVIPSAGSGVQGTVTLHDAAAAVTTGTISCLGPVWSEIKYQVNTANSTLVRRDSTVNPPTFVPTVAEVVNIQAQYGISAVPTSNQVTQWVDPVGLWAEGTISVANRNLIKAVRFAVVTRNAKIDVGYVTGTCKTAQGVVNNGPCAWDDAGVAPAPRIDLSVDYPSDWQRFHYRVFETVIPLRNVIWSATTLAP